MTDPMRRSLLLGMSGAFAASAAESSAPPPLKPPAGPTTIPEAWERAPSLPLWPGRMPGEGEFKALAIPKGWPVVFVRSVASPSLRVFRPARPNGKAVLVVPGGAYYMVSIANEGVDIAERLNALGYAAFVLTYRLPSEGWGARADVPLQDGQRAMRVIRSKAPSLGLDPDAIAVLGFSAGGHLAASLATGFSETVYRPVDAVDTLDARPRAAGLIYPVITMTTPYAERTSRLLLLGKDPSAELVARRSPEQHVGPETPPLFLAHAFNDSTVKIESTLMMIAACRAAGRPTEAHLFQEGEHAFGVGYPGTPSGAWIDLFHVWLQRAEGAAP